MLWAAFCALNERRRAIRNFDGSPVADEDVRAILEQALLAPSSGNLQPYEVHWVRDPAERVRVARACRGQPAATSAGVLLVFSCSVDIARRTAAARLAYVNRCDALDDNSKSYHREQVGRFTRFMRWGTSAIWSPLYAAVCALWPALAVVPIGAAAARGLDSCPMEGFDGRKVASVLALPRGTLIPIVIALGRRSADARVEPRWRRDFSNAVVIH